MQRAGHESLARRARVRRARRFSPGVGQPRPDPGPSPARSPRSNAAIRQRLAAALPIADLERMSGANLIATPVGPLRPAQLLRPLSRPVSAGPGARPLALALPLIVIPGKRGGRGIDRLEARRMPAPSGGRPGAPARPARPLRPLSRSADADASMPQLAAALGGLPRRAYAVDLPPRRHLARLRTVQALAGVLAQAVLEGAPAAVYIVAGVGMGGVVAHEVAAQLQRAGAQVGVAAGLGEPA